MPDLSELSEAELIEWTRNNYQLVDDLLESSSATITTQAGTARLTFAALEALRKPRIYSDADEMNDDLAARLDYQLALTIDDGQEFILLPGPRRWEETGRVIDLDALANAVRADVENGLASVLKRRPALVDAARGEVREAWSAAVAGEPDDRAAIAIGSVAPIDGMGGCLIVSGDDAEGGSIDVARRAVLRIEASHQVRVTARFARITNPADPSGHSIELRLQNLDKAKAILAAGNVILKSWTGAEAGVANGILTASLTIGRPGSGADYEVMESCIYATLHFRLYGDDHETALESIAWAPVLSSAEVAGGVDEVLTGRGFESPDQFASAAQGDLAETAVQPAAFSAKVTQLDRERRNVVLTRGFGDRGAVDIEMSGGVISGINRGRQASRAAESAPLVFRTRGFGQWGARNITLSAGRITNIDTDLRGPFVTRGFYRRGASSVELGADGQVKGADGDKQISGAFYIGRNVLPEMHFDESSGTSYWDPDDVIEGKPVIGQSLAAGTNPDAGDAIISVAPTYSGHSLMPRFQTGGSVHIEGRRFADVVDLVEQVEFGCRQTMASSMADHYIRSVYDAVGAKPTVLSWIAAKTAQPYSKLKYGAPVGNDFLHGLIDSQRIAAKMGRTFIVPTIHMNHGQNAIDGQGGVDRYMDALQHWRRWLVAAVRRATGQAFDPVIVLTQVEANVVRDIGSPSFYADSASIAQARLRHHPGFAVAMNDGWLPLSSDGLHPDCEGQYLQGIGHGVADFNEICGEGHTALFISDLQWRSTTVLDLEMSVPNRGDIGITDSEYSGAFDAAVETQGGLQFADSGGLIAKAGYSLSIIDPADDEADPFDRGPSSNTVTKRWLRVTFSVAPSGPLRWSSAMRDLNSGTGRSHIATAASVTPIDTLPSGYPFRHYLGADYGVIPALT